MDAAGNTKVVLFDGVCNFCNFWVNFAIRRDKHKKLLFSPLQGKTAGRLLAQHGIEVSNTSSVIFADHGKIYTHSSAALRIAKYLDGGWKLLYGFIIIPKFIRDFFYTIIARNRYRWFGRKDQCMVPTAELRSRFIE